MLHMHIDVHIGKENETVALVGYCLVETKTENIKCKCIFEGVQSWRNGIKVLRNWIRWCV